jgi:NTP pyrophosphatase (non-canonical NTP hydrolase)
MMRFEELDRANEERSQLWPGGDNIDEAFLAMEIGEEAGELQAAIKKMIRYRKGIAGNSSQTEEELLQRISEEVADVFINASRVCVAFGISPEDAIREKFNRSSVKVGVDVYL